MKRDCGSWLLQVSVGTILIFRKPISRPSVSSAKISQFQVLKNFSSISSFFLYWGFDRNRFLTPNLMRGKNAVSIRVLSRYVRTPPPPPRPVCLILSSLGYQISGPQEATKPDPGTLVSGSGWSCVCPSNTSTRPWSYFVVIDSHGMGKKYSIFAYHCSQHGSRVRYRCQKKD